MNKTLYIRDADARVWKDADRFLASRDESIGQVITRLLRRELAAHSVVHTGGDAVSLKAVCHCAQCNAIRGER